MRSAAAGFARLAAGYPDDRGSEGSEIKSRRLYESHGLRTYVVVFDKGDPAHQGLTTFARREAIDAASLSAVGAFSEATLAYFDPEEMDYIDIEIGSQVEVLSLLGDVAATHEGGPEVHAHVVLGHRDGSTSGGHLKEAIVFPTLEVVVTETPHHLRKRHDPETGLTLIDPTA